MIADLLTWARMLLMGDAALTTREYTLNINRLKRRLQSIQDRRHRLFMQAQHVERELADLHRLRIIAARRRRAATEEEV